MNDSPLDPDRGVLEDGAERRVPLLHLGAERAARVGGRERLGLDLERRQPDETRPLLVGGSSSDGAPLPAQSRRSCPLSALRAARLPSRAFAAAFLFLSSLFFSFCIPFEARDSPSPAPL